MVDAFPAESKALVRTQLAACLAGIICQVLLPAAEGPGQRQAVAEVLVASDAVRAHIAVARAVIGGSGAIFQGGQKQGLSPIERKGGPGRHGRPSGCGAGLALELADDAAHGHVAGQKHGVDERGKGLGSPWGPPRLAIGRWQRRGRVPDHPFAVGYPDQREGRSNPKRGDIFDLAGRRNKGRDLEILISGLPSPPVSHRCGNHCSAARALVERAQPC